MAQNNVILSIGLDGLKKKLKNVFKTKFIMGM